MKKPIAMVQQENSTHLTLPQELNSHLYTFAYHYLQPNGWFNDHPCDESGMTPWMTFPAIEFLKDVISKQNKVLEYGSGYSTVFFNNLAGEVVSIEHDIEWVQEIQKHIPDATIYHAPENEQIHPDAVSVVNEFIATFPQVRTDVREHDFIHGLINNEFAGYASKIYNYPRGYFDVIVLDGMARSLSGIMAIERIADNGMIILDNSDRWHYNVLQQYLKNHGYKRIDFWGPGFNSYNAWCTSIFCKNLPFTNHNLERPVTEGFISI